MPSLHKRIHSAITTCQPVLISTFLNLLASPSLHLRVPSKCRVYNGQRRQSIESSGGTRSYKFLHHIPLAQPFFAHLLLRLILSRVTTSVIRTYALSSKFTSDRRCFSMVFLFEVVVCRFRGRITLNDSSTQGMKQSTQISLNLQSNSGEIADYRGSLFTIRLSHRGSADNGHRKVFLWIC